MMRVLIPSLDLNGERAIWCPSASKQKLTTIDLSNPDFFFKKVDYKSINNKFNYIYFFYKWLKMINYPMTQSI